MKKIFTLAALAVFALAANAQKWVPDYSTMTKSEKVGGDGADKNNITVVGTEVAAGEEGTQYGTFDGGTLKLFDGTIAWGPLASDPSTMAYSAGSWVCQAVDESSTWTDATGETWTKSYIQGNTNGSPKCSLVKDGVVSAHIEFACTADGTLWVAAKYGKNKPIWLATVPTTDRESEEWDFANSTNYCTPIGKFSETDGSADTSKFPKAEGADETSATEVGDAYTAYSFPVTAGNTYMFFVSGSKLMLNGVKFVAGTAVQGVAEAKAEAKAPVKVITANGVQIGNYNVAGQQVK